MPKNSAFFYIFSKRNIHKKTYFKTIHKALAKDT